MQAPRNGRTLAPPLRPTALHHGSPTLLRREYTRFPFRFCAGSLGDIAIYECRGCTAISHLARLCSQFCDLSHSDFTREPVQHQISAICRRSHVRFSSRRYIYVAQASRCIVQLFSILVTPIWRAQPADHRRADVARISYGYRTDIAIRAPPPLTLCIGIEHTIGIDHTAQFCAVTPTSIASLVRPRR